MSYYVDWKLIGSRQLNELQTLKRVKFQNKAIYERSVIIIIIIIIILIWEECYLNI